jgi:hypothetical protein
VNVVDVVGIVDVIKVMVAARPDADEVQPVPQLDMPPEIL